MVQQQLERWMVQHSHQKVKIQKEVERMSHQTYTNNQELIDHWSLANCSAVFEFWRLSLWPFSLRLLIGCCYLWLWLWRLRLGHNALCLSSWCMCLCCNMWVSLWRLRLGCLSIVSVPYQGIGSLSSDIIKISFLKRGCRSLVIFFIHARLSCRKANEVTKWAILSQSRYGRPLAWWHLHPEVTYQAMEEGSAMLK